jgi:hypothetical protein
MDAHRHWPRDCINVARAAPVIMPRARVQPELLLLSIGKDDAQAAGRDPELLMVTAASRTGSQTARCSARKALAALFVSALLCGSQICQAEVGKTDASKSNFPTSQVTPPTPAERTACLRWIVDAASDCSTAEEIAASVESVLDRQVFVAGHCDIRVLGSVSQSENGGWSTKLSFATSDGRSLGTRHLFGADADCSSLRGSISLVIALMVETTDTTIATTDSVPLQVETPDKSRSTSKSAPRVGRPAAQQTSLDIAPPQHRAYADLRGSYGLLPGASFGAALGLDAMLAGVLPGRVEATVWFPKSRFPRSAEPHPGGRFWAWHTGLDLCPNLNTSESPRMALCAGAQVGVIQATGLRLDNNESSLRPYGQAETRFVLSFPLGSIFALSAHIGLALPLIRPRFVYLDTVDSPHEVHQPNVAIFIGGLGLIWRDSNSAVNRSSSQ